MDKKLIVRNLHALGIFENNQLEKEDIEYWWLIKYKELHMKKDYEGLYEINDIKDELQTYSINTLKNFLSKKKVDKSSDHERKYSSDKNIFNKNVKEKLNEDNQIILERFRTKNHKKYRWIEGNNFIIYVNKNSKFKDSKEIKEGFLNEDILLYPFPYIFDKNVVYIKDDRERAMAYMKNALVIFEKNYWHSKSYFNASLRIIRSSGTLNNLGILNVKNKNGGKYDFHEALKLEKDTRRIRIIEDNILKINDFGKMPNWRSLKFLSF